MGKLNRLIRKKIDDVSKRNFNRMFRKKIETLNRKNGITQLSAVQQKEIKTYFNEMGIEHVRSDWHEFYTGKNGVFNEKYIPEDLFYSEIEPKLNRKEFGKSLMDKNLLEKIFPESIVPETIVKNINGINLFDSKQIDDQKVLSICCSLDSFVIKPTINSGGGKKVQLIKNDSDSQQNREQIKNILQGYGKDFTIQKQIHQNDALSTLNPSSINTIRVVTYMNKDSVLLISSILRIGREGQFTDNSSAGGISIGIADEGKLKHIGYDGKGNSYSHSDSQISFKGFSVPQYNTIVKKALQLHLEVPHFKLVSWDFCIDSMNRVVLIEFNTIYQEINFHQLNNGPLFGPHTDSILKELKI